MRISDFSEKLKKVYLSSLTKNGARQPLGRPARMAVRPRRFPNCLESTRVPPHSHVTGSTDFSTLFDSRFKSPTSVEAKSLRDSLQNSFDKCNITRLSFHHWRHHDALNTEECCANAEATSQA